MLALVTGGVRSGKSKVAEELVRRSGEPVVYVATGWASDDEMAARIELHRQRRPLSWRTVETADPEAVLRRLDGEPVLVDALGPWLARLMEEEGLFGARVTTEAEASTGADAPPDGAAERILRRVASFAAAAAARPGLTVVVGEEVGMGLVPVGPYGPGARRFLDLCGQAAQLLASSADDVRLVVAGRSLQLPAHRPSPAAALCSMTVEAEPCICPSSVGGSPPSGSPPSRRAGDNVRLVSAELPGHAPTAPLAASCSSNAPAAASQVPDSAASVPGNAPDLGALRLHGDAMVPSGALDFAVNVVPGLPPGWLMAAVQSSLARLGRYPDESAAVGAVAGRHGREPSEVLVLNGSAEAFWLLAAALRPSRAVCIHPMFTEGEAALRAAGHVVERVYRDPETFALNPASVSPDADLVLVCNPNNPTGRLESREVLERLARPGRTLVVDEAFMDLCEGEDGSLTESPPPGVVVLRSLTKVWSVPGLRAGYLLGPPDVVAALRSHREPWAVSAPALAAIEACASRPGAAREVAARIAAWRGALVSGLRGLPGMRVWPSSANFVLAEVPGGPAVCAGLLERGIAVRRADTFPGLGPGHLRVAVRGPEDTGRLMSALRAQMAPTLVTEPVDAARL